MATITTSETGAGSRSFIRRSRLRACAESRKPSAEAAVTPTLPAMPTIQSSSRRRRFAGHHSATVGRGLKERCPSVVTGSLPFSSPATVGADRGRCERCYGSVYRGRTAPHCSKGAGAAPRAACVGSCYRGQMRRCSGVMLLVFAVGCSAPAADFARRAEELGFGATLVQGTSLSHVVFRPPGPVGHRVHVYLDADGTPWLGGLPASDPTPRRPLILALMARDPAARLYLGRPCYHGLASAPGCTDALWTSARYSVRVVDSMAAALRRI